VTIFGHLRLYFEQAKKYLDLNNVLDFNYLLSNKTEERSKIFLQLKPQLQDFNITFLEKVFSRRTIKNLIAHINIYNLENLGVFHGDLCATNIFWDINTTTLKFIDPRGDSQGRTNGVYGDLRYDIAKLFQSFILGYDYVLAGGLMLGNFKNVNGPSEFRVNKKIKFSNSNNLNLTNLFQSELLEPLRIDKTEIEAIATLLVMSLMPLHRDRVDRQNQFMHIISYQLEKLGL
jgi:hypothetical protein